MAWALIFGIVAICVGLYDSLKAIFHGLMWAGAWSSVGWFLGFLFGIPRFLSTPERVKFIEDLLRDEETPAKK